MKRDGATMRRNKALIVALGSILVLGCVVMGGMFLWQPPVPSHRGDGRFQDLTHRFGPFGLVPGYCISFPEFDLAAPYRAEYRVAGLPNGKECGVALAIRDPDDRLWRENTDQMEGELRLELINSHGESVISVSGRLGDYDWCGFNDLNVLYQMDKSFFTPDSAEEYRVRISYLPDPKIAGYKGFLYLRSGGTK